MEIERIKADFTVCKLKTIENVDFSRDFVFLSRTDDEISLVCESSHVPQNVIDSETGWKMFRVCGVLDFGMIGVISRISKVLADENISIFVVSTFNTDYILVKSNDEDKALKALGVQDII